MTLLQIIRYAIKLWKKICTILRDISYSPSSGRSGSSFIFSTSILASFKILRMTSPGSDLYLKKLEKNVWIGEIFILKLSKFHLHELFRMRDERTAKVHCRNRVVPAIRERVKSPPTKKVTSASRFSSRVAPFFARSHILLVCVLEKTLKIEKLTS